MSQTTALDSLSPFTKVLRLENHVLVGHENPNYKNKEQEPINKQPVVDSEIISDDSEGMRGA